MSDTLHSPLRIQILLACYISPEPRQWFPDAQWFSAPAKQERDWLMKAGMLTFALEATERGKEWVTRILNTEWKNPEICSITDEQRQEIQKRNGSMRITWDVADVLRDPSYQRRKEQLDMSIEKQLAPDYRVGDIAHLKPMKIIDNKDNCIMLEPTEGIGVCVVQPSWIARVERRPQVRDTVTWDDTNPNTGKRDFFQGIVRGVCAGGYVWVEMDGDIFKTIKVEQITAMI